MPSTDDPLFSQDRIAPYIDGDEDPFPRPRTYGELMDAQGELSYRVWYQHHLDWVDEIEATAPVRDGDIWREADIAASKVEDEFGADLLVDLDRRAFIEGKLSAIRWALGYEWDDLDT